MNQDELHALEDKCIQEHAPVCTAACPLHVDARAMLAAAAQGNLAEGQRIFQKTTPFPEIIARVCDAPCEKPCKRAELGGVIAVRAVELACLRHGGAGGSKITPLPRKKQHVAVAGGGLSGLTAAFDLARKGYAVSLFEAKGLLGGRLRQISPQQLPVEAVERDLAVLTALGVEIHLETPVVSSHTDGGHPQTIAGLRDEFEAILLSMGELPSDYFGLEQDARGGMAADAVTLATAQDGVFAAGGLLHPGEPFSPIRSMSEGRRAAISIDRYLQRVSLTAMRINEGHYETRLYTSLEGIPARAVIAAALPSGDYTREEAAEEARRCIQCQCLECVRVCEYLDTYKGYPKKHIRTIYNNLSIVQGNRLANKMINSCSLCGLCAEVCPTDLSMADICRDARRMMVVQKRMPASAHDFALRDLAFSNSPACELLRMPSGKTGCDYLFFPGCALGGSDPLQVRQAYEFLSHKLPGQVGLFLHCCGAPAEWAGREDPFNTAKEQLTAGIQSAGNPVLVTACPTCTQVFRTVMPEVRLMTLWQLLDQVGLPEGGKLVLPGPLAVHDPCAARYDTDTQNLIRRFAEERGLALEELHLSRERTECCGFGGLMHFTNPELAERVAQRRVDASARPYLTYCAMCRDLYAAQGKASLHILDVLFPQDETKRQNRPGPGYSQRRQNRIWLKNSMLKEVWGEPVMPQPDYAALILKIQPEVQRLLDKRLILHEEIQQVIQLAGQSGQRMLNEDTGHLFASARLGSVTYWVEYTPDEAAFIIHGAYSHRMEIGGEKKS